jgi:hypothetical protein
MSDVSQDNCLCSYGTIYGAYLLGIYEIQEFIKQKQDRHL